MNVTKLVDPNCVSRMNVSDLTGALIYCHSPYNDLEVEGSYSEDPETMFYVGLETDDNCLADHLSINDWLSSIPEFSNSSKYEFDFGAAECLHTVRVRVGPSLATAAEIEVALNFIKDVLTKYTNSLGIPLSYSIDDSLL